MMTWRRQSEPVFWKVSCNNKTSPLVVPYLAIGARCLRCNAINAQHPNGRRQLVVERQVAA